MNAADEHVLSPKEDRSSVMTIEIVAAITNAEVFHLSRRTRSGTHILSFNGHRTESFEEVVTHVFHDPEGSATPILQDRSCTGFLAISVHLLRQEIQRLPHSISSTSLPL